MSAGVVVTYATTVFSFSLSPTLKYLLAVSSSFLKTVIKHASRGGLQYLCEVSTTERPSLMMLRMQFQRARRALGSIPVVGSSCHIEHSQVNRGPQVEQEKQAEHNE